MHLLPSFPQHLSCTHKKARVWEAAKVSEAPGRLSPHMSHILTWRDYFHLRGSNALFQMQRKHHSRWEGICVLKNSKSWGLFSHLICYERSFYFSLMLCWPYFWGRKWENEKQIIPTSTHENINCAVWTEYHMWYYFEKAWISSSTSTGEHLAM